MLVIKTTDHERERFAHRSEIGGDVERIGHDQHGYDSYDQPARDEAFTLAMMSFPVTRPI